MTVSTGRGDQTDILRQKLLNDPTDLEASLNLFWPPMTRPELVDCSRWIQRSVLLHACESHPAPLVSDRLAEMHLRIKRLIEVIRHRAAHVAAGQTWSTRATAGQELRFPLEIGPAQAFKALIDDYEGEYEHALNTFVIDNLRPNDVFVDIGAHIGYTSAVAASTGASVYAMEVQRDLIPLIERMAVLNGFDRLRVLHAGASDTVGLAFIRQMLPHLGFGVDEDRETGLDDQCPDNILNDAVPLLTLDTLFASRDLTPALVKVDVEGHEINVLNGAREIIARGFTLFLIEFHPHLVARHNHTVNELFEAFPQSSWQWKQLTKEGLNKLSGPNDIREDPNDPNPKIVFQPI